jgi:PAS domain S-box-containing protein
VAPEVTSSPRLNRSAALSLPLYGAATLAAGLLVCLCAMLAPAWAIANARALAYVGLNSGACLVLAGAALLLSQRRSPAARVGVNGAACAMTLLALATLLQPLHGLSAHSLWQQYLLNAASPGAGPAPWPGRMRTAAALAFACAGPALFLLSRLKGRVAAIVPLLGVVVAALALPSLFSALLGDLLFDRDSPAGLLLPVPAALGVLTLGCGLVSTGAQARWFGFFAGREDRSIFVTSFVLFSVLALVASTLGVGLVSRYAVEHLAFAGPLRQRLLPALGGMTLLVLAGASLLQLRTQPLVQRLMRTRARLDAILDNVPAGVLTFDDACAILSANRFACALFGYRPHELAGRHVALVLAALPQEPGAVRLVTGRAKDGRELALEVRTSDFMLGDERRRIAIVQDVGERLRMEQALREREASLAHAQQLAHLGSWELDVAAGSYRWSDETYRIFGLVPGGEPPGHGRIVGMIHPEDRAAKLQAERDAVAGISGYDVTFRLVLASGEIKVIHSRAEAGREAGGGVRLRGTLQDITEKAWADAELRKREEEYRALVENSPDVVIRFDRSLRCVYVNPALAGAPGLHPVIGYGRMLGDDDRRAAVPWAAAVRKVLEGGGSDAFEVAVDAAGTLRHYQVQVVPELSKGGVVATVLATARDISAIRCGEAVLRESEQRLAGIAANTPGAVIQCVWQDDALSFTYASEGVAALFGAGPAALIEDAACLTGRLLDADRAAFFASLARSARSLRTLNWEGRALAGDGRTIWVNLRATPRMAGAATVWEGLVLDITDSKRNEQQLNESRQLLRELSAHHEQVREEERKKIAREVHDELGQALTALRMDVALLRMTGGPHSEALLGRMGAMKDAVDRTIGIVRNVTSALRPAALDLGLVAALEWQADEFARRSGIECVLNADEAAIELGDGASTALFRIVQESLTNVLKHAGATQVEVTLEATGDGILLEVRDNGRGFAPDCGPRRGKFGLVGMRERALMLGGRVDINSAAGAGTSIIVRLPQPGDRQRHRAA